MLNLTQKPYLLTTKQADSIHQLVSEMTTEEKIGQLFFVIGQDEERVSLDDFIDTYKPGGSCSDQDQRPKSVDKLNKFNIIVNTRFSFQLTLNLGEMESSVRGLG